MGERATYIGVGHLDGAEAKKLRLVLVRSGSKEERRKKRRMQWVRRCPTPKEEKVCGCWVGERELVVARAGPGTVRKVHS